MHSLKNYEKQTLFGCLNMLINHSLFVLIPQN